MSAAFYLAKLDFNVTIFEAAHEPGGLLRYAIPEFRLPQRVIDEQFSQLKLLGVDIQTDAVLGRTLMIDEIFLRGFSAVVLATGASLPVFADLPGSSLGGVYYDMEFLYRLQSNSKEEALACARRQNLCVPKTVVVGRGPAAFDAARLSLRLGSDVQMIFEGFEEEALVDAQTLRESREEGLEIHSMKCLGLVGNEHGFVKGVKCLKLDIVEKTGGLKLEPAGEPIVLEAQAVIIANGHRPGDLLKQALAQLKWQEDGALWADPQTGMTSMEKVFGCGSLMTAGGSVVEAIAGGKSAAHKIAAYLGKS
jgi:glutamate synthase (NADPH/NADH) small chain